MRCVQAPERARGEPEPHCTGSVYISDCERRVRSGCSNQSCSLCRQFMHAYPYRIALTDVAHLLCSTLPHILPARTTAGRASLSRYIALYSHLRQRQPVSPQRVPPSPPAQSRRTQQLRGATLKLSRFFLPPGLKLGNRAPLVSFRASRPDSPAHALAWRRASSDTILASALTAFSGCFGLALPHCGPTPSSRLSCSSSSILRTAAPSGPPPCALSHSALTASRAPRTLIQETPGPGLQPTLEPLPAIHRRSAPYSTPSTILHLRRTEHSRPRSPSASAQDNAAAASSPKTALPPLVSTQRQQTLCRHSRTFERPLAQVC